LIKQTRHLDDFRHDCLPALVIVLTIRRSPLRCYASVGPEESGSSR
jgi:hypothetical protein